MITALLRHLENSLITRLFLLIFIPFNANANVDKLYHPYVEYDTYEFETRIISLLDNEFSSDFSIYRFGFGKDVSERLFLELYLIGAQDSSSKVEIEAYEIEALYQMTEQGEYWIDVGLLFELENEAESNKWETSTGLLLEKEFGRWSGTFNLKAQYLFEDDTRHEWSANSALPFRYRYKALFEPGIEIFSSKDSFAIGPVFLGDIRLSKSKIHWEVGLLKEAKANGSDNILRALFEYEF